MPKKDFVLILDFGSQYTQLIARRIRELQVYSEIRSFKCPLSEIRRLAPSAIILSGGPSSVFKPGALLPEKELFECGIPILGICYGLQVITHLLGGKVSQASSREYGPAYLYLKERKGLFAGLDVKTEVWMSHGDMIVNLPPGFTQLAHTENSPYAAIGDPKARIFGLQFHPEVKHTRDGQKILKNFVFHIAKIKPKWTPGSFIKQTIDKIQDEVKEKRVLCALSGGVDSSVAATLAHKAIGERLKCVFVQTGLLRHGEQQRIERIFKNEMRMNVKTIEAKEEFLKTLSGVIDPEKKRKRIGALFAKLFEKEAQNANCEFLLQGTLYPDVIESASLHESAAVIKTHHNVGGLPPKLKLKLIEPLKDLFKDEVRKIGKELGLPDSILFQQPFPGPGLAVRIIGEVTQTRLETLRQADKIIVEEIQKQGISKELWQYFGILLPIKTVGVMGDSRTYEYVIALRIVESEDAMTADWARLPHELLSQIACKIINQVKGINRVVYDISSKPPATIEWE
jgi:GMP synthase (glutamine-hydrolysing)